MAGPGDAPGLLAYEASVTTRSLTRIVKLNVLGSLDSPPESVTPGPLSALTSFNLPSLSDRHLQHG